MSYVICYLFNAPLKTLALHAINAQRINLNRACND